MYMCVHMYICLHVCMCVYIYIYIYTYIHTHTHLIFQNLNLQKALENPRNIFFEQMGFPWLSGESGCGKYGNVFVNMFIGNTFCAGDLHALDAGRDAKPRLGGPACALRLIIN